LEIRYSNRTSSVLASKLETPGLLYDEIKELARQSRIQSAPKTRFLFFETHNQYLTYAVTAQSLDEGYKEIIVTVADETPAHRLERTLLKAETLTVVGQLAINALTEIRNPLTAALGFCQFITETGDKSLQFVSFISEELATIKHILDEFTRISTTYR